MKRRFFQTILSLILSAALLCPAAAAASAPTLQMRDSGEGKAELTLQNLGDREVNSVQLTLTMEGSYAQASFAPGDSEPYSVLKTAEAEGKTTITIYLDSSKTLNREGQALLGTLTLGGSYTLPSSAKLMILNHGLEADGGEEGVEISVHAGSSGTSSSSGGSSSYSIRVAGTEHGSISVKPNSAKPGAVVTVTAVPDSGWTLNQLTVTGAGQQLALEDKGEGIFTFTMPKANVEVKGVFAREGELPFGDVKEGDWYWNAVRYVYENGLMVGTSASAFGPNQEVSRGMVVTILYRMAGSPDAGVPNFTDVPAGQYYTSAVAWAAANGVVSGYGDGRFGPNDTITREQMTLILQGYARLTGQDVSARADLSGYTDAGRISGYALESVRWACAEGLITGTSSTTLSPSGTATRAQAAVIFQNFCENILDSAS